MIIHIKILIAVKMLVHLLSLFYLCIHILKFMLKLHSVFFPWNGATFIFKLFWKMSKLLEEKKYFTWLKTTILPWLSFQINAYTSYFPLDSYISKQQTFP